MDVSDFYYLDEKFSKSTIQAHPYGLNPEIDKNKLNDVSRLLLGDYVGIEFPVLFKQVSGNKFDDVLRTGTAILFLISDRMKSVLAINNLTGWQTFPAKLIDEFGKEILGYCGLSITGRCGPIDFSKAQIIEKRLVSNGPICKYYKGLYIGLDKWDGSDFFLPEKNLGIIVTKRTAEILRKNKLTNVSLQNLKEIETPDFALI